MTNDQQPTDLKFGADVRVDGLSIWLCVRGVHAGPGHAETIITAADARGLAVKLLQSAQRQEHEREVMDARKMRLGLPAL